MLEKCICVTGALLHSAFVPVVHAEQKENEVQCSTEDTIWDRLKSVAHINEYNQISPELSSFVSIVQGGIVLGVTVGGLIHSKNHYMDFMENATASKYKWHTDAKADLSSRMVRGAIRGACVWGVKCLAVSTSFAFLVNLIPIIRNEHSWIEYTISGLVSGTLAGHMFSDRKALGFEPTTKPKRITYKQLCLLRGVGFGLLAGTAVGLYTHTSGGGFNLTEMRKWEKYWKQRRQIKDSPDVKTD